MTPAPALTAGAFLCPYHAPPGKSTFIFLHFAAHTTPRPESQPSFSFILQPIPQAACLVNLHFPSFLRPVAQAACKVNLHFPSFCAGSTGHLPCQPSFSFILCYAPESAPSRHRTAGIPIPIPIPIPNPMPIPIPHLLRALPPCPAPAAPPPANTPARHRQRPAAKAPVPPARPPPAGG